MTTKEKILNEFKTIPGVGKSIAMDLYNQGFRSLHELQNQDPEKMYQRQCEIQGTKVDRCVLYTFRCAVYFVSHKHHDPEKLKWWNWKD